MRFSELCGNSEHDVSDTAATGKLLKEHARAFASCYFRARVCALIIGSLTDRERERERDKEHKREIKKREAAKVKFEKKFKI